MKKIYILDTSVYMTDYSAIYSFQDNDIYIPMKVLDEIDNHKKRQDTVGHNARSIIRVFDELRTKGSLQEGVEIRENMGKLYAFNYSPDSMPTNLSEDDPDNQIIATALTVKKYLFEEMDTETSVVLVSRDINMRVKCDALGIDTEDYITNQAVKSKDHLYTGFTEYLVEDQVIDDFYSGKDVLIDESECALLPNEFVMLKSHNDEKKTALCKFTNYNTSLRKIVNHESTWGVECRNKEQTFAMDLLLDEKIDLVTLVGKAGTGKTLMAIAAGLEQVMNEGNQKYNKLIISRPVQPMGKDIGFLPGTMEEKMMPWLAPIQDNLENLLGGSKEHLQMFVDQGIIEIEALTFIRGRSIGNAYIIIDEAQNLTRHELKTIITRAGEDTKIILTGDIEQIDNAYVDETSNGLTHAIERLKKEDIMGHVKFQKGERSKLATIAAREL